MRRIKLTQGKYALVDNWNYEWLNQFKWGYGAKYGREKHLQGYAVRSIPKKERILGQRGSISMHNLILNTPKGKCADHKDGNTLNNQENNLRTVTYAQNSMNSKKMKNSTSKYKGVYWGKRERRWRVSIKISGKEMYIGVFTDEIKAALAYNEKAKEYFGEFAYLNEV